MDKNSFTQYRRSQIAELRPYVPGEDMTRVSVSAPDTEAGSPKLGDMIARNPANHDDVWLVAADYFAANFEPLASNPRPVNSRETSSRVSTIASQLTDFDSEQFMALADGEPGRRAEREEFCEHVRALAGSALSQDETPGQVEEKIFDNLFTRLKAERDELDDRLGKLVLFIGKGALGTTSRHRAMLNEQSKLMSDLLAVLDERICDLDVAGRGTGGEISDGE